MLGLGAGPASARPAGTLEVTATNFVFDLSDTTLDAGKYRLHFTNAAGSTPHEFVVFRLADGYENISIADLETAADTHDDSVVDRFVGAAFAPGGETDIAKLKLKAAGTYAYFCFIGASETSSEDALTTAG